VRVPTAPAQGTAEPRSGAGGASGKAPGRKGPELHGVRRKGRGTAPSSQAGQGVKIRRGRGRVPCSPEGEATGQQGKGVRGEGAVID